ncbi:recombinase family protein [Methylorubrum aminovorans]
MVRAYSYIRFSGPKKLRSDSLRHQTQAANEWAAARGLVIDESLQELGVSAFRGANRIKGALGRFHDLVEKGQVPAGLPHRREPGPPEPQTWMLRGGEREVLASVRRLSPRVADLLDAAECGVVP